eukprot:TRINITY_DN23545_c0_g1_i2.p1 TRINITY_DN23545_c0_g1~~TRINITY_DN23545_c0_g1_i2.p1  ORF type:complete len:410 (-),score=72.62 TRINITY_DN23545_c0_g1_i2:152-1381(-)
MAATMLTQIVSEAVHGDKPPALESLTTEFLRQQPEKLSTRVEPDKSSSSTEPLDDPKDAGDGSALRLCAPSSRHIDARRRRRFQATTLGALKSSRREWTESDKELLDTMLHAQLLEDVSRERLLAAMSSVGAPPSSVGKEFVDKTTTGGTPCEPVRGSIGGSEISTSIAAPARISDGAAALVSICEGLHSATLPELIQQRGSHPIDWFSVAHKINCSRTATDPVWRYSAEECHLQFLHALDPFVTKNPFTTERHVNALRQASEQTGGHDWDKVAERVGEGHTAWQCFQRSVSQPDRRNGKRTRQPPSTSRKGDFSHAILESDTDEDSSLCDMVARDRLDEDIPLEAARRREQLRKLIYRSMKPTDESHKQRLKRRLQGCRFVSRLHRSQRCSKDSAATKPNNEKRRRKA